MTRIAGLFCAFLSVVLLSGAGQPAPPRKIEFTAEQQAALDRISAYLNSIHTLKSEFDQLGPEGQLDQGEFLLEKPGKMRFEYNPPSQNLIVATGGSLYVRNARLNTVDRYSLSNTPLGLLLDDNIDLKTNSAVTGIDIQPDALIVHARSSDTRQQGNITLVFSAPAPELRQWTVKDNQGGITTVALHGLTTGIALDPAMFAVPVRKPTLLK